jgi:outer membrane receptor protein involved in Fe transport
LEGNNKLGSNFKIDYRVGGIFQDSKYDGNFSDAGGLNITNKFSMSFAKAPSITSQFTQVQTQAVFGQVNLSFKDAVYLDASLRNDWDSRLPKPPFLSVSLYRRINSVIRSAEFASGYLLLKGKH